MIRHAPSIGIGIGLSLRGSGVGFSGLLDQYGGAAAAYSLRALSSGWLAGDVVEVRRSSDSTTQGFTANQITNGDLLTFCGVGDGFVSTWYDQSGNANNATQITTTAQPKIVSAGALVTGGLDFDGVDDGFDITGFAALSTTYYSAAVAKFDVSPTALKTIFDSTKLNDGGFAVAFGVTPNKFTPYGYFDGNTSARVITGSTDVGLSTRLFSAQFKSAASVCYLDGASDGTLANAWTTAGSNTLTKSTIGYDQETAGRHIDGKLSELIIYESDQSANRADIEANINAYYSIYV